jgi:plasmid stability protein
MAAIQVKNVPDDIHEALRARAKAEGTTVGEVILEAIRRDLRKQEMRDWLVRLEAHRPDPPLTREQTREIMREVRAEMWGDDDDGA